jgi:hypothetical protein
MPRVKVDCPAGSSDQVDTIERSCAHLARSTDPASIASQRLKTPHTTLLLAVPAQPLRTVGRSAELGSPFCRHAALASQGGQQVLESHADVKPIENSFGG